MKRAKTVSCKDELFRRLADPKYAAGYLSESLELGEAEFLVALRDVVEAHGGVAQLAKAAKLSRENLYRLLSKAGNPRLSSLTLILSILGLEVQFAPKAEAV